jgi:hypothetical protein
MLVKQLTVLSDIPVIKIGYTKIEKNIKKERKTKNGKVKAIFSSAHCVLHYPVDTEDPKWLYQQIQEQQECKICNKFSLHTGSYLRQ